MEQKTTQNLWFAQPLSFLANTVKGFFSFISQDVKGTTSYYLSLLNIKTENQNLKKEIAELKARMTLFDETQLELNRLRDNLNFTKQTKMSMIPAQVIGRDLVPDHKTITINKGSDDGIKELQAAITMNGAVGYVFKAEKKLSHIMLITDRYAVVDALIQKNRGHAIIEGLGKDKAQLEYINLDDMPSVGDTVVTGGLDNIFPKGFPIAIVSDVKKSPSKASSTITLKPITDSEKIEELFIITNAAQEDFLTKTETKGGK